MSDYHYNNLIKRMDTIEKDVRETRERVFNGLSDLPGEVRWIRNLLVGMLISALLGLGGLVIQTRSMITAVETNTERVESFEKLLDSHIEENDNETDNEAGVRTERLRGD